MEKLESPDAGLAAPPVRLPTQLSLRWGEAAPEPEPGQPPDASVAPDPAPQDWTASANAARAQVIEAETRRAKMVCVGFLGLVLLVLRYVGS